MAKRRWRPELHPRNPKNGKFVERGGSGWAQSLAGQLAAVRQAKSSGSLQDPTFLRGLTRAPEGGFQSVPGGLPARRRDSNAMSTMEIATRPLTRDVSTGKIGGMTTSPAPRPGKRVTAKNLPEGYEIRNSGNTDYAGKPQYEVYGPDGDVIGTLTKTEQENYKMSGRIRVGSTITKGYSFQIAGSTRSGVFSRTAGDAIYRYNREVKPTIDKLSGMSDAQLDAELRSALSQHASGYADAIRAVKKRRARAESNQTTQTLSQAMLNGPQTPPPSQFAFPGGQRGYSEIVRRQNR